MGRKSSPCETRKLRILSLALFFVCSFFLSQSVWGATLNLTAKWTANTDQDTKNYRLYRTDGTRTLIGTVPHPNTSYPFAVTIPDGSAGTLLFVLTALDASNNESADSNLASYPYDLSKITFSGSVRNGSGAGISGVVMSGLPGNPATNINGYYSVKVSAGWSGTVTPTKNWYVFTPSSRSYSNVLSDQSGQDYTGTISEVISTPKAPVGPSTGYTGTSHKFSTGGSTSNVGPSHPVEYRLDWGNGTLSPWGPNSQLHVWTVPGTYSVKAQARCKKDPNNVSAWSNSSSISVQIKPFIQVTSPNGGENLVVGNPYQIAWNSAYLNPGGTVYLFYGYDGAWHPIATLSPGSASFSWTIPKIPEKVTLPKPSGLAMPASLWIGNWVNEKWECYDKNDYRLWILYDGWVCTISGGDRGGATLLFDEGAFDGYGISLELGIFGISGNYSLDAKGLMSGAYRIYDFDNPANVFYSGNFTGSLNSSLKSLKLALKDVSGASVFNVSGQRLLNDPVIPRDWTGTISGAAKGTLDSLTIDPYQLGNNVYSHVFEFSGSGSVTVSGGTGSINIIGYFYFTGANVYGNYQITGAVSEEGTFTGSLNPSSGKINITMTSSNRNKYTLGAQKITP